MYILHTLSETDLSDLMRSPLFLAAQRNNASLTLSDDDESPPSLADESAVYAQIKEEKYDDELCRSSSTASVRSNDPRNVTKPHWEDLEIGALLDLYESRLHLLRTEDGRLGFWSSVAKLMEARGFNVKFIRFTKFHIKYKTVCPM